MNNVYEYLFNAEFLLHVYNGINAECIDVTLKQDLLFIVISRFTIFNWVDNRTIINECECFLFVFMVRVRVMFGVHRITDD